MPKIRFLSVLGLLTFCSPASLPAQEKLSVKEIVQRESPAIVSIYNLDAQGKVRATGTGFIVRADGVVITNYHVIRGAQDALVKLKNGEVYDRVSVIDYHPVRDIAILKITAMNLPTVMLGDSEKAEPGDEAVAIGNPKGLEHTVSNGLISAKRIMQGTQMLQISVPISPGSSGGPLYNMRGEVIGITTSGLVGEGTQNLNFAVPLKYALPMLESTGHMTLAEVAAKDVASEPPGQAASQPAANRYTDPGGTVTITVEPGWTAGPGTIQGTIMSLTKGGSNFQVMHMAGFTDVRQLFGIGDSSVRKSMKNVKTTSPQEQRSIDGHPFMGQFYAGKKSGVDLLAFVGVLVTQKGGLICMAFTPGTSPSDTEAAARMCASLQ
jgi:S1-C subfamily serine protease